MVFADLFSRSLSTPPESHSQPGQSSHALVLLNARLLKRNLVLRRTSLGKLEADNSSSQSSVHLGISIQAVIHTPFLLLIQHNLQSLAAILLGAKTLADNLNRVDEISQNGIVNCGQCSGTGSLLGLRGTGAVGALGTGKNAARGEDQDVAVRELLLKLTGETVFLSC